MTKDRKRTLLSGWTGGILIAIGYAMIRTNYSFFNFAGGLLIIFTYLVWQFAISYPLVNKKSINRDGKEQIVILNASGEDVTKRLPACMLLHLPCFVIISGFLIHYAHLFMIKLESRIGENYNIISKIDDLLTIYMAYFVIHIYYFIKDLPVSTITRYYRSGSGAVRTSSGAISYRSSNEYYWYSPTSSSYGSNIFHSFSKNR